MPVVRACAGVPEGDRGAAYRWPLYASPPLLRRMVAAGLLGRKTGRGFYAYGA